MTNTFQLLGGTVLGLALLGWMVTRSVFWRNSCFHRGCPVLLHSICEQDSSSGGQNMSPQVQTSRLWLFPVAPEAVLGRGQDMGSTCQTIWEFPSFEISVHKRKLGNLDKFRQPDGELPPWTPWARKTC